MKIDVYIKKIVNCLFGDIIGIYHKLIIINFIEYKQNEEEKGRSVLSSWR